MVTLCKEWARDRQLCARIRTPAHQGKTKGAA